MKTTHLYRCLFWVFTISLFLSLPLKIKAQVGWTKSYKNGIVVTAEKHASKVGRRILKQGGNAIDAAVAVQFALAVTLPRAGNIGGGGFMVIHLEDGSSKALDFREQAPLKADKDMYIRDGKYIPKLSREGALASGVPGTVHGMVKALNKYGTLSLKEVIEPAIKLARNGYPLSYKQTETLNNYRDVFEKYEGTSRYFLKADSTKWKENERIVQTDLAKTLERIAKNGRAGFYEGQTADLIVKEMENQGGLISHEDLKAYESIWRTPVRTSFMGFNLHIMPPPSSGSIAIAQILDMLNPYDLKQLGFNSAKYIHLLTETMRRAFADRAHFLGDPDFVNIPQDKLLYSAYNKQRMESFSWDTASTSDKISHGDIPFPESHETTHFSIVDKQGNAVAVTTTLNGNFGSKVAVDGAGFFLNNEMDDFTAEPGEPNMYGLIQGKANAIEPQKRMLSSMSPTIVTKKDSLRMVLGAAGGPRIITAILHNFLNMAVFEMPTQKANSAPRFHHQWMPDTLYYEKYTLSPDTRYNLEELGHKLKSIKNSGRAHTIYIGEKGIRYGAADPRGNGIVTGY